MTPAESSASYARALRDPVELWSKGIKLGIVRARVTGFAPTDVVINVQQGDRKVILLAADVAALGVVRLTRSTYNLVWNTRPLTIKSNPDDATLRVANVLIAYQLHVSGA